MSAETERFYVTGGTLPANAASYVARQADTDLDTLPKKVWNTRRSASRNLKRYLGDVVLKSGAKRLSGDQMR